MKKRNLKMLALIMVLLLSATLGGCAANVSAQQAHDSSDASSANSTSMAEAYEDNEVISVEEQKKAEEIRRSEIAEQYVK